MARTHGQMDNRPWYAMLSKYHWFVLGVCALGWLFDCLDQQLFILTSLVCVTRFSSYKQPLDQHELPLLTSEIDILFRTARV